ncbi:MAG: hypothetical protein KH230_09675 [Enterocloster asparagiformis]|nr:hypothetical protein [Enterocloster asparagiformis]
MDKKRQRTSKSINRHGITVWFDDELYDRLKKYAGPGEMNNCIRQWTEEGLSGTLCEKNLELITRVLREQLQIVLNPYMERMISVSSTNGLQAGTSLYLQLEVLDRLLPADQQVEAKFAYEMARKKALAFSRNSKGGK